MIHIIVLLESKDADALQAFERQAFEVMKNYGGELVTAFVPDASESSSSSIAEIHYLQFPSIDAIKKYRADPKHRELSELRKKAISNTTVFVSTDIDGSEKTSG